MNAWESHYRIIVRHMPPVRFRKPSECEAVLCDLIGGLWMTAGGLDRLVCVLVCLWARAWEKILCDQLLADIIRPQNSPPDTPASSARTWQWVGRHGDHR